MSLSAKEVGLLRLFFYFIKQSFVVSESPGHCDHHRQPRGQDRHPRRGRAGEQDRVRQPQDPRPLRNKKRNHFRNLLWCVGWPKYFNCVLAKIYLIFIDHNFIYQD